MADNVVASRISCSICLEPFKNPKIIQCFHTFCAHCLKDFIRDKRKVGSFECPLCRTLITIPKIGVDGFQNNFYIQDQVNDNVKLLCNGRNGDEHKFHETRLSPSNGETYNMVLSCCHSRLLTRQCIVQVINTAPNKCPAPKLNKKPVGTSVTLMLKSPSENGSSSVTKYRLKMSTTGDEYDEVYIGSNMFCKVDNLTPKKKYIFAVQAINVVGSGPWSEPLEIILDPCHPEKPNNFAIEDISSKHVTLTWTEADDNGERIKGYVIKYNAEGDLMPASVSIDNTVFRHVIENLKPGTKYSFQMYAVSTMGEGKLSKKLTCKTIPEKQSQLNSMEIHKSHQMKLERFVEDWQQNDIAYQKALSLFRVYNIKKGGTNRKLRYMYRMKVSTDYSRTERIIVELILLCINITLIVLAIAVFYYFVCI